MLVSSFEWTSSTWCRSRWTWWRGFVRSTCTSWCRSYSRQTDSIPQRCLCPVWWHRASTQRLRSVVRLQSTMGSDDWQSNSTTSCTGWRNCRRWTIVCGSRQSRRLSHYWKSSTQPRMLIYSVCRSRSCIPIVRDFDHQLKPMFTRTHISASRREWKRFEKCWNKI